MRPPFRVPDFINVQVTIIPVPNGHGNAGPQKQYEVTCTPAEITVVHTNSIINYQIIPETPHDIVFHGMHKKHPSHTLQLSHPSVSVDGKMITFNDRCSVAEQIQITLLFRHGEVTEIEFDQNRNVGFDPQVGNDPEIGT